MKKRNFIVSVFLLLASSFQLMAGGNQIFDFEQIMESLKSGKDIKVVIHYGKCQLISDNEIMDYAPEAIGGMTIETWEYFAENAIGNNEAFVVTSTSHLIENPLGDGYVYNYVKIKISAGNNVKITARYLDSSTMEEIMDENFFSTINNGKNDGAVYFYKTE